MSSAPVSQKRSAYFRHLLSLLLFGSNGLVASRIALDSYEIVLLRTLIGSVFLIALFGLTKGKLTFWKQKKQMAFLAVSGAAMGASWMLLYEAYQNIGVSLATLAYYCGPVLVMALSPLLFHEKLTAPRIAGFAAVLAGVFLINGQALRQGNMGWGLFCGALSAVMYALMVIANKKAVGIDGLENAMLQLVVAFVTVAVFVGCKQGLYLAVAPGDWLPILLLGVLNTGFGCYLYFSSIGQLPVQMVAICGYLEPLAAVLFSVLLLGEVLTLPQAVGAALILGGAVCGSAAGAR